MLEHPDVPDCHECQQWLYEPKNWTRQEKSGKPIPRKPGMKLPCRMCPKQSPDISKRLYELNEDNQRAVSCYREIQAVGVDLVPMWQRNDPLFRRVQAIIHQRLSLLDQSQAMRSAVAELAMSLMTAQAGL